MGHHPAANRLPPVPVLCCLVACAGAAAAERVEPGVIETVTVVSAGAASGVLANPEHALDGNPDTEFTYEWPKGGAWLLLDLGEPYVLEALRVTNGHADRVIWLQEVGVGADREHFRPLLGRPVNLAMWRPAETTQVRLPLAVGRYVRVSFAAGPGRTAAVSEVALIGRLNRPERHLMCWSGDVQRDFLDQLDYLDRDLGATDLWLDYVETAFPQTNHNSGFEPWVQSGALDRLRERGIRYWLSEHEAFTQLVNEPEDLRDDLKWETTLRQMRHVYARARELGFRGLVYDVEDYGGVTEAARERYQADADFVDAWCFADEFGYAGLYYQRGLQVGRVIREVWGCPLMQVYEARMYAGKGDCRAGNYWWLLGLHHAGVEVWLATEKTYGAGQGELADGGVPSHLTRWFVHLPEFLPKAHAAYPFAARVLPGFHPWNSRLRRANYLPRYLDEQIETATSCAPGYWIYTEGTRHAGDPRQVLDRELLGRQGIRPEDYLAVFAAHPTTRRQ